VQVVGQQLHADAPPIAGLRQIPSGRVLQRRILLKGRSSGEAYVAAESLVAVDLLPPAITKSLTETQRPIGEVMAASYLETFKENAQVWIGPPPDWLALPGQNSEPRIVARRYCIMAGGQPAIIITEHFLRNVFRNAP
jgi:chorismate lyase